MSDDTDGTQESRFYRQVVSCLAGILVTLQQEEDGVWPIQEIKEGFHNLWEQCHRQPLPNLDELELAARNLLNLVQVKTSGQGQISDLVRAQFFMDSREARVALILFLASLPAGEPVMVLAEHLTLALPAPDS